MKTEYPSLFRVPLVALVAVLAAVAPDRTRADDATAEKPAKASAEQEGVKREIVFEDREGEYRTHYDPAGEIPSQRYAARVLLELRFPVIDEDIPSEVVETCKLGIKDEGHLRHSVGSTPRPFDELLDSLADRPGNRSKWFFWLMKQVPDRFAPPGWDELIATKEAGRCEPEQVACISYPTATKKDGGQEGRLSLSMTVLADDKEHLKDLVRAVVAAMDRGFSDSYHQSCAATLLRVVKYQEALDGERAELEKQIAAVGTELDSLNAYTDMNKDALAAVLAQKRMLDVDLAGVRARVEACREILVSSKNNPALAAHVEELKITAEIELAGLTAKQEALDKIVSAGRRRLELEEKRRSLQNALRDLDRKRARAAFLADWYRQAVERKWAYAEVAPVMNGKIHWEPAPANGEAGSVWWLP